jgi:hypothetical protein
LKYLKEFPEKESIKTFLENIKETCKLSEDVLITGMVILYRYMRINNVKLV